MHRRFAAALFVTSCILLTGCGSGSGSSLSAATSSSVPPAITLEELADAPRSVTVGSQTLLLKATIYRNFQPTVGETGGAPLVAAFSVSASDGSSLPSNLSIETAWVVQGSSIGTFTAISPPTVSATSLYYSAVGGPQWAPGSTAEAVVEILDPQGKRLLLQTPAVTIGSAD